MRHDDMDNPDPAQFLPVQLRTMSDQQLLEQCRWEAFRGPGPGGQKRNKTSSAVRITHLPTGLSAIARESRSQTTNRREALLRLRHRLALELRDPVDLDHFRPPTWLKQLIGQHGRLAISIKDERYPAGMGLILDLLSAAGWSVSDAAGSLGISTGSLVKFVQGDDQVWGKVNQMRQAAGLRPLIQ
jgi:hypothetical protein